MANLRKWLEDASAKIGQPFEAIVVGPHYKAAYSAIPLSDENCILPAEAALAKLDQEFDDGFGGADCFPFLAWTRTRVYFVHEYDGAVSLVWVPRGPITVIPEFGGLST